MEKETDIIKKLKYIFLIGKDIEVLDSSNKKYNGLKGKIIDETAKTILILNNNNNNNLKRIFKKNTIIKIKVNNEYYRLNLNLLEGNLISRIKKMKK